MLIQVKGQRVILHKRMEMGNECSDIELRYFKKLFSKRDRVDTSDARSLLGEQKCLDLKGDWSSAF